jgi:hypothetical protein
LCFDDQLEGIVWAARFGQVGHIACVPFATFLTVGGFPVIRRLQTGGIQLLAGFGPQARRLNDKMFLSSSRVSPRTLCIHRNPVAAQLFESCWV